MSTVITNPKPTVPAAKPTPAATEAKNAFVNRPKPGKLRREPRSLADPADRAMKMLCYGPTGTGKTLIISDFLEAGLTVLALSVDFGGEGFTSVEAHLKDIGRPELLANCLAYDFATYDEVEEFLFNPTAMWPDIYEKDIDLVFLDGFSSFQMTLLDEKIMSFSPQGEKAGDAREAGLWSNQQDWGAVKKGTTKILDRFLRLKNEKTGKVWHKFVTCHENSTPKLDKLTGETRVGPYLQGAGASLIEPSFDLIFRTRKKRVEESGKKVVKYLYELEGSDSRILTKTRGLHLPATADGDFLPLWKSICQQKGIPSGKPNAA